MLNVSIHFTVGEQAFGDTDDRCSILLILVSHEIQLAYAFGHWRLIASSHEMIGTNLRRFPVLGGPAER